MASFWQPGMRLADVEKDVILSALAFFQQDKPRTAFALGITIVALKEKLQEHVPVEPALAPVSAATTTEVTLTPATMANVKTKPGKVLHRPK